MRVKPYAIRSPSRNARHTALRAPGGSISTSGCSCRYRSSLRTWSGGPGGTSCTGQYRYPVSGPRNRLPKHAPPAVTAAAMDTLRPHGHAGAHRKSRYHHHLRSRRQAVPPGGLRAADTTGLVIRLRPSADQVVPRRSDVCQPTLMPMSGSCTPVYITGLCPNPTGHARAGWCLRAGGRWLAGAPAGAQGSSRCDCSLAARSGRVAVAGRVSSRSPL